MSQLELKIRGKKFRFFNDFSVTLNYNGIASTFSFSGYYDIEDADQKALFKPLSYHEVEVYYKDKLILTGTALSNNASISDKKALGTITGYSKTGVLEDSKLPLSLYPLQFDGLTLKEITEKVIKPFGLKLSVDSDVSTEVNKVFETISIEATESVKDFLAALAKQRNVILTHDAAGNVVYTRLNINKPSIATYKQDIPTTNIGLSVNGQGLHSEITAQKQATLDSDVEGEETIENSLIPVFRPTTADQSSGDNNDTISSAKMARSTELRNIRVTVDTDRWQWFDGKKLHVIQPNEIIDIIAPDIYIPDRTRFFVERVTLSGDEKGATATIETVLPETYNGEQPKNIFK